MLLVDLPGQGSTFLDGMIFEPDTERALGVVDALLPRPEVDPRRIVALGVSLGGDLVLRAASVEWRLAAIAVGPLATLRVTTVQEGADGHCQSSSFPVLQRLVFDWFERLRDRA